MGHGPHVGRRLPWYGLGSGGGGGAASGQLPLRNSEGCKDSKLGPGLPCCPEAVFAKKEDRTCLL